MHIYIFIYLRIHTCVTVCVCVRTHIACRCSWKVFLRCIPMPSDAHILVIKINGRFQTFNEAKILEVHHGTSPCKRRLKTKKHNGTTLLISRDNSNYVYIHVMAWLIIYKEMYVCVCVYIYIFRSVWVIWGKSMVNKLDHPSQWSN